MFVNIHLVGFYIFAFIFKHVVYFLPLFVFHSHHKLSAEFSSSLILTRLPFKLASLLTFIHSINVGILLQKTNVSIFTRRFFILMRKIFHVFTAEEMPQFGGSDRRAQVYYNNITDWRSTRLVRDWFWFNFTHSLRWLHSVLRYNKLVPLQHRLLQSIYILDYNSYKLCNLYWIMRYKTDL